MAETASAQRAMTKNRRVKPAPAFLGKPETPLLSKGTAFKVAVAGHNRRGGRWLTTSHRAPTATWEETVCLARVAGAAGIDAVIGDSHMPGPSRGEDWTLEPFAWAASLAPVTTRIQLIASVPAAQLDTDRTASMSATIDHISGGRFGLNVITDEAAGSRSIPDIGRYAVLCPVPTMSARRWAVRHADIAVVTGVDAAEVTGIVRELKDDAAAHGRDIGVMVNTTLVCGETQDAAGRLFEHFLRDLADWDSARGVVGRAAPDPDGLVRRAVIGHFATPVVGTPEAIVDNLASWAAHGVDGIVVSWVDYAMGLREYDQLIRPLLVAKGLRRSPGTDAGEPAPAVISTPQRAESLGPEGRRR